jgi:cysteine desulfurase family protein (TIGR01976 family)
VPADPATTRTSRPPSPSDLEIAPLGPIGVAAVRARFPALKRQQGGRSYVFLDGPGGTQVPQTTIDAASEYLRHSNANHDGAFATSQESDALLARAHAEAADFLGAEPHEVVFGQNMTTLTFAVSRAIGRTISAGDEIVVTRLDHDANVAPWLALEEERGAVVRWVEIRPDDCTLDLDGLARAIGRRTKVVAVGMASNAVGTINPIEQIVAMARAAGALTYVDAVHAAPHLPMDAAALGADFLVCSPYKFFGPHLGLLYGRGDLLERLSPYKVRPAPDHPPGRWESGTLPGEALAGLLGTFTYLEWLGEKYGGPAAGSTDPDAGAAGRRARLRAAMAVIRATERGLARRALIALGDVPGLKLRGITDPDRMDERVPTFAFTMSGRTPREVAAELGRQGVAVWDGDFYAWELIRALGLAGSGGLTRVGLVHYNTTAEIDRLVEVLLGIARTRSRESRLLRGHSQRGSQGG